MYDLVASGGRTDGGGSFDHGHHDVKNSTKIDSLLYQLNFKPLMCMTIVLMLVVGAFLQSETLMFTSNNLVRHQRETEQCAIPKWNYPNCKPYLTNPSLAIPTPRQWYDLRQAFEEATEEEASSLDPAWKVSDPDLPVNAFHVPIEVRISPGKGRGVFLAEAVSKGQLLWDNRYTARFPDECSVRKFFAAIGDEAVCNVVMWGYVNDFYGQGLQFQVDLDPSAFFNEPTTPDEANTVNRFPSLLSNDQPQRVLNPQSFFEQRRKPGAFHVYATEDMPAGTELLFNYSDVHMYVKLYYYEKLCMMTRGVWGWLTM